MKFAKELEQELVPEWRAKYLDYKTGKKKVKAISRALQRESRSNYQPLTFRRAATGLGDQPFSYPRSPFRSSTVRSNPNLPSIPQSSPTGKAERQPLKSPSTRFPGSHGSYGSIGPTPPSDNPQASDLASLKLPDPAIDPSEAPVLAEQNSLLEGDTKGHSPVIFRQDAVDTGSGSPANRRSSTWSMGSSAASRHGTAQGTPSLRRRPSFLKRVFSIPEYESPGRNSQGEQLSEVEQREDEFFAFLDSSLSKIESFYKTKETEATDRLKTLRQQLHIMGDQRIQEVLAAKNAFAANGKGKNQANGSGGDHGTILKNPIKGRGNIGKNSDALQHLASPAALQPNDAESVTLRRDFMRRPEPAQTNEVPYRTAKRKLKLALQEFYRGLELLKSYAYLNRTAFRKINKKYDKVTNSRPTMRYMSEKVNKAWFVQSDIVDSLMVTVEDLYTRYFERGNHKIAVSKLRHTGLKPGDYSPNTFRVGLLLMGGILFGIQALVYAAQHLHHPDPVVKSKTSYLLQIYGGFFLVIFHFLLFCLDCMIWTRSKINYVFVFEFDTRHALDWRQLLEIPSIFFFLLGLFMWLNFSWINGMYIYWPVVLVAEYLIVMFLPARVFYHRSRQWWLYSNWRLLLAGLYPVEFRDFFLGDMYCSQTYSMGNIALFFCLYAKHWGFPEQCNSSHSRLLGFFTCLPSIWRAFQCLRRFADTKSAFPHLLNFVKYICGVLYYLTLSLYRIDKVPRYLAVFIVFALLNAIYTSIWDLVMDWSLCNPYAKRRFLREMLAFRNWWVYYVAMVLDVIIRFNWIFYAIFTREVQHSAILSFFVSFSEVCRRGMWSIFRVENEHCTNVLLYRASRDLPLPYEIPSQVPHTTPSQNGRQSQDVQLESRPAASPFVASGELEQGPPSSGRQTTRARRPSLAEGMSRVGTMMATAHAQDFQRRKNPDPVSGDSPLQQEQGDDSHDDSSDG